MAKKEEEKLFDRADDILENFWERLGEEAREESAEEYTSAEEGSEPAEREREEKKEEAVAEVVPQKLLDLLPEKFRSGDPVESLKKFVEAYQDLEQKFTRTAQELTEATKLLQSIARSSSTAKPVEPERKVETDEDLDIKIDLKPEEVYADLPGAIQKAVVQAAKQVVSKFNPAQQTAQAMQAVMAQMAIAQLRARDPKTFELVKEDLLQVLREKPHLDTIDGLELAYQEAVQRYKQRQEELRRQLIDENFINSLKESVLRELAQKVGSTAREATGVPQSAGGAASALAKEASEKLSPADALKKLIQSASARPPLFTEDFG